MRSNGDYGRWSTDRASVEAATRLDLNDLHADNFKIWCPLNGWEGLGSARLILRDGEDGFKISQDSRTYFYDQGTQLFMAQGLDTTSIRFCMVTSKGMIVFGTMQRDVVGSGVWCRHSADYGRFVGPDASDVATEAEDGANGLMKSWQTCPDCGSSSWNHKSDYSVCSVCGWDNE